MARRSIRKTFEELRAQCRDIAMENARLRGALESLATIGSRTDGATEPLRTVRRIASAALKSAS